MATEIVAATEVTTEWEFHKTPAFAEGMFAVRPGVEKFFALSLAEILMNAVIERQSDLVSADTESYADEHFVTALLLDMSRALYRSTGAVA